ncbi:glycosyltransferase family 2 protein [Rasiella sp. SM2506]|uniref:glycosyltransferase family 2 protein n=1 Tax=Rasiella sp. SM2506 TaxID=3423914 RepID=UPI003D7BA894
MMFTVVIPLFNKEQFIRTAIISVLQQSYSDFELLVIDDGSTDGSGEIVKNFTDPRLKYVNKEHAGVAATRNVGIQMATSTTIAFLDADDWWAPTFLEEAAAAIAKFPTEKLFATGRIHVLEDERKEYKNIFLPDVGETAKINHYKVISQYLPAINMSNAVVLKQHVEKQGYFAEGMQNHEDHEFWLRLAVGTDIVFVNKPLSFYRKTSAASQSHKVFTANDFETYLNTCREVQLKLSEKEQKWFQTYLNKFVVLSYIKYRNQYTKNETELLQTKIEGILTGFYSVQYRITKSFPNINVYRILKRLND